MWPWVDLCTGSIWLAYNPFTWVDVAHQHRDCLTYKCESLQRLLDWCARKKWVIGSQWTDAWTCLWQSLRLRAPIAPEAYIKPITVCISKLSLGSECDAAGFLSQLSWLPVTCCHSVGSLPLESDFGVVGPWGHHLLHLCTSFLPVPGGFQLLTSLLACDTVFSDFSATCGCPYLCDSELPTGFCPKDLSEAPS